MPSLIGKTGSRAIFASGVLILAVVTFALISKRHGERPVVDIALPSYPWLIRPSPNGDAVACVCVRVSEAGQFVSSVVIVELTRPAESHDLAQFNDIVHDITWSPHWPLLALGTEHGHVEVWNMAIRQRIWAQKIDHCPVWQLAYAKTTLLAVSGSRNEPGSEGKLSFLNAGTGEIQHVESFHDTPSSLAINSAGNLACTGCYYGGLVTLFDVDRPRRLDQFGWRNGITGNPRDAGVNGLAFSDDGRSLVVAGDGAFSVWDIRNHQPTHEHRQRGVSFFHPEFVCGSTEIVMLSDRPISSGDGEPKYCIGVWQIDGPTLRKKAEVSVDSWPFALVPGQCGLLIRMKQGIRRIPLPGCPSNRPADHKRSNRASISNG